MATLNQKIDFVAIVSVTNANPNGDPLNGNRPRTDYEGFGEISAECIKRKIRNRMQDLAGGSKVFVQTNDRHEDEFTSLASRAKAAFGEKINNPAAFAKEACKKWLDVRSFGQVFAFKSNKGKKGVEDEENGVSIGVRGPVSIHQAVSISPVDVATFQITKSVNGDEPEKGKIRSKDTMGTKHFVRFGLYKIKGSINVQLAEKTGFSDEDASMIKECLRTLFTNDASATRPDGSMEVVKLYWWKHNCKDGQYSSAKVHRSVKITLKDGVDVPNSVEDYAFSVDNLEGLEPEIIDGV